ncbi:hypothetical protein AB0L54_35835 [Streptomyces sp. NPDC052196]|uniref:hypothetical protein n=1 Tax=Streptomyces sp. NPDC052196 TaxID=3156691 RepID=UPI0034482652
MTGMVLYVLAFWALTGALAWRCWKKWRRGADQLRADQWDALAVTLLVMPLPVIGTLGLLDAPTVITVLLCGSLFLGTGACHVAKSLSTRRADEATRTMRTGLGLPVARRLVRTTTVAAWWLTAAVLTMIGWMGAAVVSGLGHREQMTEAERQLTAAQTVDQAAGAGFVVVAAGVVHCVIQQIRRDREERRVRADEQRYLAAGD